LTNGDVNAGHILSNLPYAIESSAEVRQGGTGVEGEEGAGGGRGGGGKRRAGVPSNLNSARESDEHVTVVVGPGGDPLHIGSG